MEHIDDVQLEGQDIRIVNSDDYFRFSKSDIQSLDNDPFNIPAEDIKKLNGLGTSFRRKVSRDIQKRFEGIDGAKTQQNLLQQAITGYAMFDLVQPVYNT
jgi:hypothetical protein